MKTSKLQLGDYTIDVDYDINKDKIYPTLYGLDVSLIIGADINRYRNSSQFVFGDEFTNQKHINKSIKSLESFVINCVTAIDAPATVKSISEKNPELHSKIIEELSRKQNPLQISQEALQIARSSIDAISNILGRINLSISQSKIPEAMDNYIFETDQAIKYHFDKTFGDEYKIALKSDEHLLISDVIKTKIGYFCDIKDDEIIIYSNDNLNMDKVIAQLNEVFNYKMIENLETNMDLVQRDILLQNNSISILDDNIDIEDINNLVESGLVSIENDDCIINKDSVFYNIFEKNNQLETSIMNNVRNNPFEAFYDNTNYQEIATKHNNIIRQGV